MSDSDGCCECGEPYAEGEERGYCCGQDFHVLCFQDHQYSHHREAEA